VNQFKNRLDDHWVDLQYFVLETSPTESVSSPSMTRARQERASFSQA